MIVGLFLLFTFGFHAQAHERPIAWPIWQSYLRYEPNPEVRAKIETALAFHQSDDSFLQNPNFDLGQKMAVLNALATHRVNSLAGEVEAKISGLRLTPLPALGEVMYGKLSPEMPRSLSVDESVITGYWLASTNRLALGLPILFGAAHARPRSWAAQIALGLALATYLVEHETEIEVSHDDLLNQLAESDLPTKKSLLADLKSHPRTFDRYAFAYDLFRPLARRNLQPSDFRQEALTDIITRMQTFKRFSDTWSGQLAEIQDACPEVFLDEPHFKLQVPQREPAQ